MSYNTKYNRLFGPKDEKRISLFIATVKEIAKINRQNKPGLKNYAKFSATNPMFENSLLDYLSDDSYVINQVDFLQNGNFDNQMRGASCDIHSIHPEWAINIADIIIYINKVVSSSLTSADKIEVLGLIKSLHNVGSTSNFHDNMLIINMVKALYTLEGSTGFNPDQHTTWDKVTNILSNTNKSTNLFNTSVPLDADIGGGASGKPSLPSDCFSSFDELAESVKTLVREHTELSDEHKKVSGYNPDEHLARLLIQNKDKPISNDSIDVWDEDTKKSNTYYRDEDNKLYRLIDNKKNNDNNNRKYFDSNDKTGVIIKNKTCESVGLDKTTGKNKCTDYITKCLSGNDIKECKDFLGDTSNIFLISDEIKHMHPENLRNTIRALQIPTKQKMNTELDMMLTEVVTFDEWIEEIEKLLTPDEITKIIKHETLRRYINYLVSFVNEEPAILNENYVINDNQSNKKTINPKIYEHTFLSKFGLHPNYPRGYGYATDSISISDVERLYSTIVDYQNQQRMMYGIVSSLRLTGGFTNKIDTLNGGAPYNISEIYNDSTKQTHTLLSQYYAKLVTTLSAKGKELARADKDKIETHLQSLEKSEKALLRSVNYINEYVKLLNIFGEGGKSKNLTYQNLKEFVDQRNNKFNRISNKQLSLVSIIRAIASSIN